MSDVLEGRCHCGGVSVTMPADTPGVVACHCEDCQRLHGNFFALLAADADRVRWGGELQPQWYASSDKAQRAHCPRCGSRLAKRANGSPKLLLSAGLFDRHLPRTLVRNLYGDSKPDWYELPPTASP